MKTIPSKRASSAWAAASSAPRSPPARGTEAGATGRPPKTQTERGRMEAAMKTANDTGFTYFEHRQVKAIVRS